VKLIFNQTYDLLLHADAAIVTSGTATLETALLNVPQIVVYHLTPARLTPILRKWIIRIPFISLVNIIAQRQVVFELIGSEVTTERLIYELNKLLNDDHYRTVMLDEYKRIQTLLGNSGASDIAAATLLKILNDFRCQK